MKPKAVRATLAALLTGTLLISVFPPVHADSGSTTIQQSEAPSKTRRGKNGDPAARGLENPNSPIQPADHPLVVTTSAVKTLTSSSVAPQEQDRPVSNSDTTFLAGGSPAQKSNADSAQASGANDQPGSGTQQREAPPFDRPPLRAGRRTNEPSVPPSGSSPTDRSKSSDAVGDPNSRGDSRSSTRSKPSGSIGEQRNRYPDTSAAGSGVPERSDRSSGAPPVLNRPADSRSQDERTSAGPPVLRRSGDPQPNDGDRSENSSRPAGAGKQQAEGEDDVVKLESTLVNLPLLVSDRSGRYIPQLSARDFSLYEDGVQQTIASFGTEEVPFSVVLLLDVSPSVQGNVDDIQEAAIAFVRQLRSQDRVMVASFDRQIHYLSDFTNDRRELEWAIRKANTGSGTSVYDAVFEVVQRKLRNVEGRKALILFSDGEDTTSSRASYDEAVNVVTESDVLVYGLRYPGSGGRGGVRVDPWPRSPIPGVQLPFPLPFPWPFPRRRRGPFRLSTLDGNSAVTSAVQSWPRRNRGGGGDFMADVTTAGGGPVYDAERISDLSRLAHRIAEELRHVYVVSYYPSNPLSNGGYRSVRVSVKGRDDIAVRHRRGYNARPSGSPKPTI